MADPDYAIDDSGLLVPPHFDQGTVSAPQDTNGAARAPMVSSSKSALGVYPPVAPRPAFAPQPARPGGRRDARPSPVLAPAGRANWVFGALGIITALASFVWPLVCLTVLVSLALSAVGISRANRLRHRGATGRAVSIVGLVIGLASAANLVFGISQMLQLGGSVSHLLP